MSLILDALRKMEQERRARSGGSIDIRPDLLDHRGTAPVKRSITPFLVAAGIAVLTVGVGAGFLLNGKKPTSSPEPAGITASPPLPSAAAPIPSVSPQPTAPAPQIAPAEPAPAAATTKPTPPTRQVAPPLPQTAQGSSTEEPSPGEQSAAGITVSGIAWQEERNLRRAVVNGSLMAEGASVAGARIVEIGERRVRFSRGGQSFDIHLSSAFPSR
ncbi:hypothetical protein [Geobacter pickeringii]|uniref:Uncharacterized protein n=1 Tax=Geobacter pickeringii TaxID=345632 RepID=A0A0B5BGZ7_9BACT|nr:hypothetical protein [Geobacter pickeringii]AJE03780.1 hypothetical protein GPICK_10835 [Geobacter pickeringii]